MFKNYIKIAFRNINRYKGYSFINIVGLAIGMACFLLIALFVRDEFMYDRFHVKAKRIYRVIWETDSPVAPVSAVVSMTTGPRLKEYFPEIQKMARLEGNDKTTVCYQEKMFNEEKFYFADQSIFDIFNFVFIQGDPQRALEKPNSVVLAESVAKRYFGESNAIGKSLTIDNKQTFQVTGIITDLPSQSHFHPDFLASMSSQGEITDPWAHWGWTYLLLPKDYPPKQLEKKIEKITNYEHLGWFIKGMKFRLQPLTDIHLYSNFSGEIEPNSDIRYIYIFSIIAILTLLIACINYMNLTTARSTKRSQEIGIRKVVGSSRSQLLFQFLNEAILISFCAIILAFLIVELSLPLFNSLVQKNIKIQYFHDLWLISGAILVVLIVGIISGSYPGLFLSAFQPVRIIKGFLQRGKKANLMRKVLVVFQFSITIALIVSTIVIHRQLQFIQNKKLGFDRDSILILPIRDKSVRENYESIKNELLQYPDILNVSVASGTPLAGGVTSQLGDSRFQIKMVDHDYIPTFGMVMVKGRNFNKQITLDKEAYILNETAVKMLELKNPIGEKIRLGWARKNADPIIGVVKDFHNNSLHRKIEPLVFQIYPKMFSNFLVKIEMKNFNRTLNFIEKKWREFSPYHPFEFSFLNDQYDKLYKSEQRLAKIFNYFSLLTIFIACLGLFGLASFLAENLTKEIAIRKVLGASINQVVFLLSNEFIKLVLVANFIAWPIIYFVMNKWLQNFAYQINISWWMFVLAGVLALVIALLTVSYQAIRAATANPVDSLRYE